MGNNMMNISKHLVFNLDFKPVLVRVLFLCYLIIRMETPFLILAFALYILDSQYFDTGIIYAKYRRYLGFHAVHVHSGI